MILTLFCSAVNRGRLTLHEERVCQLERVCELLNMERNHSLLCTEGALHGSGLFPVHAKLPPNASQKGKEIAFKVPMVKKRKAGRIRNEGSSSSQPVKEGKKFYKLSNFF